jgi:hypothetical protein
MRDQTRAAIKAANRKTRLSLEGRNRYFSRRNTLIYRLLKDGKTINRLSA